MFNLFSKKKTVIEGSEIRAFNTALIALKEFIHLKEFAKAKSGIEEIKDKEKKSFDEKMASFKGTEKDKQKELKKYSGKIKELEKIELYLAKEQIKYENILEDKRFKIREKRFKEEINALIKKNDFINASYLVGEYLKKYNDNNKVITYCNKQRKAINKLIERDKLKKEREIKKDVLKEAKVLMGDIINLKETNNLLNNKRKLTFKEKVKLKLSFYKNFKQKVKNKKMLDEISLLINEEKVGSDVLTKKLTNIHSGLSKELTGVNIPGYDFYGKILGADKISGDSFGIKTTKNSTKFFIGDATGHGVKAGFMVSFLTQQFEDVADKGTLEENVLNINNNLKQDLKSGNFITSIFFETKNDEPGKLNYVGMGHEPMFFYKQKTKKSEKVIAGGLAAGIRINNKIENIRRKTLEMDDKDVLITFSDGIIEAKSPMGEMYGFNRLQNRFEELLHQTVDLQRIYDGLISDVTDFVGGSKFGDDLTIILIKRCKNKDLVVNEEELKKVAKELGVSDKETKKLKGKSKDKIKEEIQLVKRKNELKAVITNLKSLYMTGEILKLKQESIRYIKEGFIHERINFYLKKALDKEQEYKIQQRNEKIQNKYNILKSLYDKGDYDTVAKECADIIAKDGNI